MPPIQYPVRPSAHVTANVHVPTSDRPDAGGPRTANNERRSAIVPPPIANVRPHIGMTRYKGTVRMCSTESCGLRVVVTGLQTSCYKSVHKLSTSCVRTACSQLL